MLSSPLVCTWYPGGHSPHSTPPLVLMQATIGLVLHPPLLTIHSLTSWQLNPLPVYPEGHKPHLNED